MCVSQVVFRLPRCPGTGPRLSWCCPGFAHVLRRVDTQKRGKLNLESDTCQASLPTSFVDRRSRRNDVHGRRGAPGRYVAGENSAIRGCLETVYDCFAFSNELDLLEIRLEEMASNVNRFIIAESPLTFQGKPKPLVFHDHRRRFRRFAPCIHHIVVDDTPVTRDPWNREHLQRNALRHGLADAEDDALVLVHRFHETDLLRGDSI